MSITKTKLAVILLSVFALQSCVESSEQTERKAKEIAADSADSASQNKGELINVGNELFSIPSPLETALLIESSGADFDPTLPNSVQNLNNYATDFDKSLVMGVYGADLAYTAIFSMNQEAITYLGAVEKLANELNLTNAIDKSIIRRFSKNVSQRDSMLTLSSIFFRSSDMYLKENERQQDAALILIGGWIEGIYLAYNSVESNDAIKQRLAEQKITLGSIMNLMGSLDQDEQVTKLTAALEDLKSQFDQIESTYEYQRPEVNAEQKRTVLKSKTTFDMTDAQLNEIGTRIESIRNNIVG